MIHLRFETLLRQALTDWPEFLDLSALEIADATLGRYSVKGLVQLAEKIDEKYIGDEWEVILRELHWSIFTIIHDVARSVTSLPLVAIRAEAVRLIFHDRLRRAVESKDAEWKEADYEIVRAYFETNA